MPTAGPTEARRFHPCNALLQTWTRNPSWRIYEDQRSRRTISGLRRISTPGLRIYRKSDSVPRVLGGLGVAVLSTSQGLMTDREARKRKVGGEVLCYVW